MKFKSLLLTIALGSTSLTFCEINRTNNLPAYLQSRFDTKKHIKHQYINRNRLTAREKAVLYTKLEKKGMQEQARNISESIALNKNKAINQQRAAAVAKRLF